MEALIRNSLLGALAAGLEKKLFAGDLAELSQLDFEINIQTKREFGDYSSNMAMLLASRLKQKPRDIAQALCDHMNKEKLGATKLEVAGPGFINIFLSPMAWAYRLHSILDEKKAYGRSNEGQGKKVLLEFVSANPTGPLHIGHGRGAVVGDVLASILEVTGFKVAREFYINDRGNQIRNLGLSVLARLKGLAGEDVSFPEDGYHGDYVQNIAQALWKDQGKKIIEKDEEGKIQFCADFAKKQMLQLIKKDLASFGVEFDAWFSEEELFGRGDIEVLLQELKEKNLLYENEAATWFKATELGDEKDHVVIKKNGELTYLATDMAYHRDKFQRGFDWLIDIWGADHHGHISRIDALVKYLGRSKSAFQVVSVQMVSLFRGKEKLTMSKRKGVGVTLREVIDEVGKDSTRFFFLLRSADAHLDFDLQLAKQQSNENPVYYVQYAHARICSILRKAEEEALFLVAVNLREEYFKLLVEEEEILLLKHLIRFPEFLTHCARDLAPHRLPFYLMELAKLFHAYYNKHRIVSEEERISRARLLLVEGVRQVIANGLSIIGVDAPKTM